MHGSSPIKFVLEWEIYFFLNILLLRFWNICIPIHITINLRNEKICEKFTIKILNLLNTSEENASELFFFASILNENLWYLPCVRNSFSVIQTEATAYKLDLAIFFCRETLYHSTINRSTESSYRSVCSRSSLTYRSHYRLVLFFI